MTTVGGWLAGGHGLDRRDAEVLLGRAAGLTRAQLLARPERELTPAVRSRLDHWAMRRRGGEPVAYILGEREFWGLTFTVSDAVLVPRPETELLVELALAELTAADAATAAARRPIRLLELGTGSGAIAIALAVECRRRGWRADLVATDVSVAALALAACNGRRHGVEIHWVASDWYSSSSGRYDLIVANPPYVAADDPHLAALAHEPRRALVAGCDGLAALSVIAGGALERLRPGGAVLLEHGRDQGAAVRHLLARAGLEAPHTVPDLAGLDRVSRARAPGSCP